MRYRPSLCHPLRSRSRAASGTRSRPGGTAPCSRCSTTGRWSCRDSASTQSPNHPRAISSASATPPTAATSRSTAGSIRSPPGPARCRTPNWPLTCRSRSRSRTPDPISRFPRARRSSPCRDRRASSPAASRASPGPRGPGPGSLTYAWTQLTGPTVVLTVLDAVASFTAPQVSVGGETLTFRVTARIHFAGPTPTSMCRSASWTSSSRSRRAAARWGRATSFSLLGSRTFQIGTTGLNVYWFAPDNGLLLEATWNDGAGSFQVNQVVPAPRAASAGLLPIGASVSPVLGTTNPHELVVGMGYGSPHCRPTSRGSQRGTACRTCR